MTEIIDIPLHHAAADLLGRAAMPEGAGPHPAVLVMHNAHGQSPHMIEVARRLAAQGYVAVAGDMYGGGRHYPDQAGAGAAAGPLWADRSLLRDRIAAWYQRIQAMPQVDAARVAAIGYCFGGQCVLELARGGADVKAVVSYHGLLNTDRPAAPGAITARVAVFTGTLDPYVPQEDVIAFRTEMVAAQANWQITEFGDAYHSFTDPHLTPDPAPGQAYHAIADACSWAATLAILAQSLA